MATKEIIDRPPAEVLTVRNIHTTYYRDKRVVRMTSAKWANNAVLNCVKHMQFNDYGATEAEVFDSVTGELHAVVTHSVVGKINIIFRREVRKDEEEYRK